MNYSTFIEARGEFAWQINFLSKAISDDETRFFMQVLHIEASEKKDGSFMGVTTDGRRLHKVDPLACPFDNLNAGDWRVVKSNSEIGWIAKQIPTETDGDGKPLPGFPAWRRVIPHDTPGFTTKFEGFAYSRKVRSHNYSDMVKFIREFPNPTVLNLDYLADLGILVWDVGWYSGNKSVTFTSGDYYAVIMPMMYEELDKPGATI
jgi:hypothetical protein